jgi:hypothetical protein
VPNKSISCRSEDDDVGGFEPAVVDVDAPQGSLVAVEVGGSSLSKNVSSLFICSIP